MGSEICNPLFFDEAPHPCRETIVKSLTYEEQSEEMKVELSFDGCNATLAQIN